MSPMLKITSAEVISGENTTHMPKKNELPCSCFPINHAKSIVDFVVLIDVPQLS